MFCVCISLSCVTETLQTYVRTYVQTYVSIVCRPDFVPLHMVPNACLWARQWQSEVLSTVRHHNTFTYIVHIHYNTSILPMYTLQSCAQVFLIRWFCAHSCKLMRLTIMHTPWCAMCVHIVTANLYWLSLRVSGSHLSGRNLSSIPYSTQQSWFFFLHDNCDGTRCYGVGLYDWFNDA